MLSFLTLPQILRQLVVLYKELDVPAYSIICQILVFLDDAEAVAHILINLLQGKRAEDKLLAYQIAFDLYENGTQKYLKRVRKELQAVIQPPSAVETEESSMDVEVIRLTRLRSSQ